MSNTIPMFRCEMSSFISKITDNTSKYLTMREELLEPEEKTGTDI